MADTTTPPAAPAAPPPAAPAAPTPPAAPPPAAPAAPAATPPAPAPAAPAVDASTKLPDDHPLVKAFIANKQKLADLKAQITGEDPPPGPSQAETELVATNLRLQVALDKGLTAGQAKRLVGTTQAELEADADQLLTEFGKAPAGAPTPPTQQPAPAAPARGGTDPTATPDELDPLKLADAIPRP